MGKNDMPITAGSSELGAIGRPSQTEHAACVGLLQGIGPLEGGDKGGERAKIVNGYRRIYLKSQITLGDSIRTRNYEKFREENQWY